ncbi:hypothetical protein F5Y19DRAFT_447571, partial [Xylariaceae sp. FL1651]
MASLLDLTSLSLVRGLSGAVGDRFVFWRMLIAAAELNSITYLAAKCHCSQKVGGRVRARSFGLRYVRITARDL